ncbi:MAG: TVP38/TMEM64 family protein [Phycisphaerales bacterium]|nr:TVP38/TMEM64 family protein [Phycisphaerales bacterium]
MSEADTAAQAEAANPLHPRQHSWKKIITRIVVLLVVVALIALLYIYVLQPYMSDIRSFVASLGPWAPLAYITLLFIATMIFLPESIIAIAGGTLFGLWMGWLWVVIACVITALFTFMLTRLFIRKRINRVLKKYPKAYAVEQATGKAGFKILFLLRLAPVNFSLLNYLGSVSPCKFRSYALACIGMIPGNFSTVYMGDVARHTADLAHRYKTARNAGGDLATSVHAAAKDGIVHEITVYGGLVLAIVASVVVGRIAIKAIHKETQQEKATPGQEKAPSPAGS